MHCALQHMATHLCVHVCLCARTTASNTHSSLTACSRWLTGRGEGDLTAVSAPCTCQPGPESESLLLGLPLRAEKGPYISLPILHHCLKQFRSSLLKKKNKKLKPADSSLLISRLYEVDLVCWFQKSFVGMSYGTSARLAQTSKPAETVHL